MLRYLALVTLAALVGVTDAVPDSAAEPEKFKLTARKITSASKCCAELANQAELVL